MEEEKVIKVWCRGSKENPDGVLKALQDEGLVLTKGSILDYDRRPFANPSNIFRSMNDAYGHPNHIGYHPDYELETNLIIRGVTKGWRQVKPVSVEKLEREKDAIRKYIMFTFNYPSYWIDKVFAGTGLEHHLWQKFETFGRDFNVFFTELDRELQNKMLTWIMENYRG